MIFLPASLKKQEVGRIPVLIFNCLNHKENLWILVPQKN